MHLLAVVLVALLLALGAQPARAQIPNYSHTSIPTSHAGSTDGRQFIAQDRQGFLWFAFGGLYRFDGRNFSRAYEEFDKQASAIFFSRVGDLWVKAGRGGIYRLSGRKFIRQEVIGKGFVRQIFEDSKGRIILFYRADRDLHVARLDRGKWSMIDAAMPLHPSGLPGMDSRFAVNGTDGRIWATVGDRLVYFDPDTGAKGISAIPVRPGSDVLACPGHQMILVDTKEVRSVDTATQASRTLYRFPHAIPPPVSTVDAKGQIWIAATALGVVRLRCPRAGEAERAADRPALFPARDLGGTLVNGIFADRTGNIWVATSSGLDRFNYVDVVTALSAPSLFHDGSVSNRDFSVAPGSRGEIYAAAGDKLYRVDPYGVPVSIGNFILNHEAFCPSRKGGVWVVTGSDITRIDGGRRYRSQFAASAAKIHNCAEDGNGNVIFSFGLAARFFDGKQVRKVATNNDWAFYTLGQGTRGELLGYIGNKLLYRIRNGVATPAMGTDADKVPFITSGGNAGPFSYLKGDEYVIRYDGRKFVLLTEGEKNPISGQTFRSPDGTGWSLSGNRLNRIAPEYFDRAFDGPASPPPYTSFDETDGLRGTTDGDGRYPFAQGSDGRLWVATTEGVFYLDTGALYHNPVPPPVFVTKFLADDAEIPLNGGTAPVKAGTAYFRFDYSLLNLANFDRSRFRVMLEGFDTGWKDMQKLTSVTYTSLPPGHYVFHVIGSNDSGVWNSQGASLAFDVPPTFLQSVWFKLIVALCVLVLAGIAYLYRTRAIVRRVRGRMIARIDERERIARDLHDTFLQAIQGLMLRFEAAAQQIPPKEKSRAAMDAALEKADEVLFEGRERVRGLRSLVAWGPLAEQLEEVVRTALGDSAIALGVKAEGRPREIGYVVVDELAQIVREFAANSVQHADARLIELCIAFEQRCLIVCISDDGKGMSAQVVQNGVEGHFGLSGMRERAAGIRAKFQLSSVPDSGTTARITVPASIAYTDGVWRTLRAWFSLRPR